MDEEILDLVSRDAHNCLAGIKENDTHLLQLGVDRLADHIIMINSVVQQTDLRTDLRASLYILLQLLESLRMFVENCLVFNIIDEDINVSTAIELDTETVVELRRQGLPWSKIGKLHGISRQSMYNYRVKYNLLEPQAVISDVELRQLVNETILQNPNAGVGFVHGVIRNSDYRVSRKRVWLCLREADPVGVSIRKRRCIARRAYKVKGSNSLWHIDSNHKLIMFRFVIHGCVDGYSRRIIYLHVANNNKARTVLTMFKEGVRQCGLPKRVRGDRGSENFSVKYFMDCNSSALCPFIFGRSVHNTRIDRLWRDVNTQVLFVYKSIFKDLEEQGTLDENDDLNLLLLSYVFLPRIQKSLDIFKNQWNNHSMRTLNNRTPLQVWTISTLQQGGQNIPAAFEEEVDTTDSELEVGEVNNVFVPALPVDLSEGLLEECSRIVVDPIAEDNSYGMNHYTSLVNHFSLTVDTDERSHLL